MNVVVVEFFFFFFNFLGIFYPPYVDGKVNPVFEKLFEFKNCFVINNGTYLNNEIAAVYLVENNEVEDLSQLVLQEEEVSEVKWMHYEQLLAKLVANDPEYVPIHNEEAFNQFIQILSERYPKKAD